MKFDVYGRFEIEVLPEPAGWVAYRLGPGMRHRDYDIVFASSVVEDDMEGLLDEMFSDLAVPGQRVKRTD